MKTWGKCDSEFAIKKSLISNRRKYQKHRNAWVGQADLKKRAELNERNHSGDCQRL